MTELTTHLDAPAAGPTQVELAGSGRRLAAYVVDTALTLAVVVALTLPWVRELAAQPAGTWADVLAPSSPGDLTDDLTPFWWGGEAGRALAVVGGTWLGIGAAYQAGFLRWRGATPGKLALGLRVRLLEAPGPLPARAVVRRVVLQLVPVALALTPWCPAFGRLVPLLGVLSVLRDDRGRAWHDLAAGTCVVRSRAAAWDAPPEDAGPPAGW